MNATRPGMPGATRTCPHCRETVLESAAVCPACRHHLRFEQAAAASSPDAVTPLRVEGNIRNPIDGGTWEYSMVLTIRNERGEEIARRTRTRGAGRATREGLNKFAWAPPSCRERRAIAPTLLS